MMRGMHRIDPALVWAFGGILGVLLIATVVGAILRWTVSAAPEKISPRSVWPKIATGNVTQPGG